MSQLTTKKDWIRWSPQKIFLINMEKNYKQYLYTHKIIEKKLYTDIKINKDIGNIENISQAVQKTYFNDKEVKNLQKEAYKKGFSMGYKKYKKNEEVLKSQIKKLFIDFDNSLLACENLLFSHLLKVVLKVSAYVIGKHVDIDKSSLLQCIKNVTLKDNFFLKKPNLVVHPSNKKIVENIFLDFLNMHNWKLSYDDNIDLNSCKVISDRGDIDATVNARWQELCRLVCSEENS
ncbi:FliH/SctL family protein [Buchnera aphidicola]|uniref:FliH/SctL family protein n=1 Tax=Buchnera aphidicola TaxID=9 RepID=UPI003464716A